MKILSPEAQQAFADDLDALYRQAVAELGPDDVKHLKKMERWGRLCTLLGYATAWLPVNPISAYFIAQGSTARWSMLTHHICHRGYDRVPNVPKRYTSKVYAKGWRRFWDWPDWLIPEAWNFEHNTLHHYHTGEHLDPDLLERNVQLLRELRVPMLLKYAVTFFYMCSWKLSYYAPNTLWMLRQLRRRKREGKASGIDLHAVMDLEPTRTYHGMKLLLPFSAGGLEFWARCIAPYGLFRFALLPLLFWPLGAWASLNVLLNSLLAEVFANIHTFLIIVPNHSGEDLYRFEGRIRNKAEFYYRQVIGSVNYTGGKDLPDFLQGYLNYQIEHHLWPDLPLTAYRKLQPQVQEVCARHGVPYVIEPLWQRVKKMLRLMLGKSDMRRLPRQV